MFMALNLGVLLMALYWSAAQTDTNVVEMDLNFPNISDTSLENRAYRFVPFRLQNKMFAIAAIVKVNWFEAQQVCAFNGLTLASIESATEMNKLKTFLEENELTSNYFWIAGTDLANEGTWFWLTTGRPLFYQNWAVGEPNNALGTEHCLQLRADGTWNDLSCGNSLYFICENRCPIDSYSSPLYN